ncbi:TonB family protein [Xinfangfangia sp. CPCC 101601]|uniref:TonB family protein n=1 Tax=Pseudogemmobacter lacusdianii TaxID=3069608 RepID=A0ABU0W251_9RHOB|nr:energy transducer TonB [Xinfangfangia sp. CPCC 101601]MDQ2067973.1 TonB family protein [Xinfangfangia sp. CPCC 101601]
MSAAPSRFIGWLLAGASSAALLSGAAALAMVQQSRVTDAPMMLDLSMLPSSAPTVAAVAEEAPEVMDEVNQQAALPDEAPPPEIAEELPPEKPFHTPLSLPKIETPAVADLALPPPPEEPVEPEKVEEKPVEPVKKAEKRPEPKPEPKPKKKAEKPREVAEAPKKAEKTEKDSVQADAKAAATGAKAGKAQGGSNVSPKAYQTSVFKKIQKKTRRIKGRGTALVGLTIAANGGLASVQILQSSGDSKLDGAALDAVRKSGPFGPTPSGATVSYSFQIGS